MKTYTAKQGDELNLICYRFYNSIDNDVLAQFYEANEHLLLETLKGGEVVNLPIITVKAKKESKKQLWE